MGEKADTHDSTLPRYLEAAVRHDLARKMGKSGERTVSAAAGYFKARTPIPVFYQTRLGSRDYVHAGTGVRVLPFHTFCRELALP